MKHILCILWKPATLTILKSKKQNCEEEWIHRKPRINLSYLMLFKRLVVYRAILSTIIPNRKSIFLLETFSAPHVIVWVRLDSYQRTYVEQTAKASVLRVFA